MEVSHLKIFKKLLSFKFKMILLLIVILSTMLLLSSFTVKNNLERNCESITEKLISVSELSTVKYNYSNVISIKDSLKFKDFTIPFTEKSFVLKYSGLITAGVDLSKAEVSITNNNLLVILPPSIILNHNINEEEIFIYDEKSSAFNKLNIKDMLKEIVAEKEKTEKTLIDNGFLEKADSDTIKFLQSFLSELGYKKIEVRHRKENN
jgi:hypothetical protein